MNYDYQQDPNQQGYDPNQQGQQNYDPNQQSYDPNQQGQQNQYGQQGKQSYDPNQQGQQNQYGQQGQQGQQGQGQFSGERQQAQQQVDATIDQFASKIPGGQNFSQQAKDQANNALGNLESEAENRLGGLGGMFGGGQSNQ